MWTCVLFLHLLWVQAFRADEHATEPTPRSRGSSEEMSLVGSDNSVPDEPGNFANTSGCPPVVQCPDPCIIEPTTRGGCSRCQCYLAEESWQSQNVTIVTTRQAMTSVSGSESTTWNTSTENGSISTTNSFHSGLAALLGELAHLDSLALDFIDETGSSTQTVEIANSTIKSQTPATTEYRTINSIGTPATVLEVLSTKAMYYTSQSDLDTPGGNINRRPSTSAGFTTASYGSLASTHGTENGQMLTSTDVTHKISSSRAETNNHVEKRTRAHEESQTEGLTSISPIKNAESSKITEAQNTTDETTSSIPIFSFLMHPETDNSSFQIGYPNNDPFLPVTPHFEGISETATDKINEGALVQGLGVSLIPPEVSTTSYESTTFVSSQSSPPTCPPLRCSYNCQIVRGDDGCDVCKCENVTSCAETTTTTTCGANCLSTYRNGCHTCVCSEPSPESTRQMKAILRGSLPPLRAAYTRATLPLVTEKSESTVLSLTNESLLTLTNGTVTPESTQMTRECRKVYLCPIVCRLSKDADGCEVCTCPGVTTTTASVSATCSTQTIECQLFCMKVKDRNGCPQCQCDMVKGFRDLIGLN